MIRMLGAVCLAAGPVWLGMSAAAELAHRERALGALCAGLELMERELALRLTPPGACTPHAGGRWTDWSGRPLPTPGGGSPTSFPSHRRRSGPCTPWGRCWGAMTGGDSRRPSPGPGGSWRDCGPGPGRSVSGWERCTGPWG